VEDADEAVAELALAGPGIGKATIVLHARRHGITGAEERADEEVLRDGGSWPGC